MRVFTKLSLALIVSSICFFSCSTSQQIACPDYSKNSKFKTPAQAYKTKKYVPPKVNNKYKMTHVRTSANQVASPNINESNSKQIEAQTIQLPTMANVLQPIVQPNVKTKSADKAIAPTVGLSSEEVSITSLAESSSVEKLKLSAMNTAQETSNSYNERKTSSIDDAVIAPPVVEKSRKEKRQALRDFRKAIKNFINGQPDGEAKPVTGFAVAALVLGIVSLFFFPFIAGPLGIIFGGIALKRANNNPNKEGRGMALAGLICGIVGTLGGLAILFLI